MAGDSHINHEINKLKASAMALSAETVLNGIEDKNIIVFDGECVLCSGFFRFVLRNDTRRQFQFMIAQSEAGEALYQHFGLKPDDYDTNLVIIEGKLYERLDGFFQVMKRLGWPYRALAVFSILPKPALDWFYYRIARNRYALFGRRESCLVPTGDVKERFVD